MKEPRVIRSISAADFARISDEFAKNPRDVMIFEIHALRAERDALRKVYEAAEDFIGAQGTAYEADQYLMLCGVIKSYNAALEVQP